MPFRLRRTERSHEGDGKTASRSDWNGPLLALPPDQRRRDLRGSDAGQRSDPPHARKPSSTCRGAILILKVSRLGPPVLRQTAIDARLEGIRSGRFDQLIDEMFETMHAYEG